MASNLSSIGFAFVDAEAFRDGIEELAGQASERLSCPPGDYAIWRSRTGAELWLHLAAAAAGGTTREVVGLTPFFEGRSETRLKLTGRIARADDSPFEGAWTAWVAPDATGEGSYPMVIEALDRAVHEQLVLPCERVLRITGFARELAAFASQDDHAASRSGEDGFSLAAQAFVPMGLFASAQAEGPDELAPPPSATAILTGQVLEHESLVNESTGRHFEWLLVDSLEARYDIVADPEIVTGSIVVGGTVEVACWLVGRLLD